MEEWKTYRLGEVCEVLDYMRRPLSAMQRKNMQGEYRYYGAQSVIDYVNDYIFDGEYMILAEDGENLKSRNEDIAQIVTGKFWLNNHAHIVKSNGKAELSILCSLLNRMDISGYITGSAQPKLNQANMLNIKLSLPPLPLQRRISSLLSSLDAKIETNRRINARLEEMAQALFRSWFIDFTPFKQQEFVEDEYGRRPKGWEVDKLGNVCTCVLGGTPSRDNKDYWNGNIAWINSGEINKFRIIEPSEYITELGLNKSATKLLPRKTTVLAITGATLGQISLLEIDSCANQSVIGVLQNERLPYEYIYPYIKENIKILMSHQTGGAQQHINKQNVESLGIVLPDKSILENYKEITKPIFEKIAACCFESSRLAALRDTLLPKLMSGEIIPEEITASRATRFL